MATARKARTPAKTGEAQVPAYIKQGQARGNENVTTQDLQLPRIDVLQALSPQTKKSKDEYIDGAEEGMLFNTLTGELFESVSFTPVSFVKRYLVWVDRAKDSAGGLRGVFDTEAEAIRFVESSDDESKLEVVDTAEHLVLLDDGTEIILSMSKSKMKVSRKFNSLVRLNGGDRFARRYKLSSVLDEGPKGEYYNFSVVNDGFPSEDVYRKAEQLYTSIAMGETTQAVGNYDTESDVEY